jgi:hypothetical protein
MKRKDKLQKLHDELLTFFGFHRGDRIITCTPCQQALMNGLRKAYKKGQRSTKK